MILEATLTGKGHIIACYFSVMNYSDSHSGRRVSFAPRV